MSKYLTSSLLVITFLVGLGVGFYISPSYAVMNDKDYGMTDLGRSDKYFDKRYIDAMIAHHLGAIQLAEQVKDKTKRPEIKVIAESILENEPKLINELYTWKKDWYNNTYKVTPKQGVNLGTYDANLDLRFINAAIAHHQAGVEMANEVAIKSTRNEIITNALVVGDFLKNSEQSLKELRTKLYEIK